MTQHPLNDVWNSRDLPVLVATVRLLDQTARPVQADEIAAATGIPPDDVQRAFSNLSRECLEVADWGSMTGRDYVATGVTAEGLRAVGGMAVARGRRRSPDPRAR